MLNAAFLNVNKLETTDGTPEILAHFMATHNLAILGTAETRVSDPSTLLRIHSLGFQTLIPTGCPHFGGLSFIYSSDLDIVNQHTL